MWLSHTFLPNHFALFCKMAKFYLQAEFYLNSGLNNYLMDLEGSYKCF